MAKFPRDRNTSAAARKGGATRTAKGRFAKGVSGNPNGRPPKPKPIPGQELIAAMSQVVQRDDGSDLTMADLMALKLVREGMGDPRIALKLLSFYHQALAMETPVEEVVASEGDDEIIAAMISRKGRRRE